jgi:hypothetical protein
MPAIDVRHLTRHGGILGRVGTHDKEVERAFSAFDG